MKFGVFIAIMLRKRHINIRVKIDSRYEVYTIVLSSWTREKGTSDISTKLNNTISRVFQGI